MEAPAVSEYNRDQWISFQAIHEVIATLSSEEVESLRRSIQPYLEFRKSLAAFQDDYFGPICATSCFETSLSACCGFESIFTFFADQVITTLSSDSENIALIMHTLARPNTSGKCVHLGSKGCIWRVRPISCAMFLCDTAKKQVFEKRPAAESVWEFLRQREKDFTWPTQPVLFDDLERFFMRRGVRSPHMYFHRSPGLLRVKAEAGLKSEL